MLEIIKEPNKILHIKCVPVTDFGEAKKIADDLLQVIKSIPVRYGFCRKSNRILNENHWIKEGENKYEILVNPVIVEKRFQFLQPESCFSLNRKHLLQHFYIVKRYLWVKVQYQSLEEQLQEIILRGPNAIYQEIDHLNGIMVSEIGFRVL